LSVGKGYSSNPEDCVVHSPFGNRGTGTCFFQQLPDEVRRSVLIELKGRRASLRQLERLAGIGKSMIYRM